MCERYSERIAEDYSTLWENWIKDDGTSNHAWTGGPLVIMSKHIAGIKPLSAGYEKAEIRPQYDLHNNISCTVPTIKGFIKFSYENKNGEAVINLEYPENIELTLYTPENATVNVNGKTFKADKNVYNF
jgi:hypothetical protein